VTYVAPDTPPVPELPERPEGARPPAPTGAAAWAPWAGILAMITALVAGLLAGLLIAVVAEVAGAEVFVAGKDPPPGVVVAGAYAQGLVFAVAAVLFARLSGPAHARDFGLRGTAFWRAVGLTIAAYVALVAAAALWWSLVGTPGDEELLDSLGVDRGTLLLVLGAIAVCVFAPIGEEVLFRGFMYPAMRNRLGVGWAAAGTGAVFGLLHAFSSPAEALVPLAVFGSLLCLLYQATGSLYPCIALHAINNSIALGQGKDWDWQIVPLALGAVAVCLALGIAAARVWRPSAA
jgi:uncharacterized protein